jgi:nucleoside-diphosphate-sugar epimerase
MAQFIVLGNEGFLGREFTKQVRNSGKEFILLNRHTVTISNGEKEVLKNREFELIEDEFLNQNLENSVVINCMWTKINHRLGDSQAHKVSAKEEKRIIKSLSGSNVGYLSFGSIKEIESNSSYAIAKREVFEYLSQQSINFKWIRIANCYGTLNSGRYMDEMINCYRNNELFKIDNPETIINVYPVQPLVAKCFELASNSRSGDFNLASDQWVSLRQIQDSFFDLIEPEYFNIEEGPFSNQDPRFVHLDAPLLTDYFKLIRFS